MFNLEIFQNKYFFNLLKMQNKHYLKYYLKIIIIFTLSICIFSSQVDAKKKKRRSSRVRSVKISIKKIEILDSLQLTDGIKYKNIHLGNGKSFFNVYMIEIDLTKNASKLFVHKMGNQFNTLEGLPQFAERYNSIYSDSLLAAVNANFWKAYSNSPIGPCIVDGKIVENVQYKNWSSTLFDINGIPFINNYDIEGSITSKGFKYKIDYLNRRRDSSGISFYNSFAGDTIPYVLQKRVDVALDSAYKEWEKDLQSMEDDSTEQDFDSLAFINYYKASLRGSLIEQGMYKVLVRYLSKPYINKPVQAVVEKYTSNFLELPNDYGILSFGTDIPLVFVPDKGDTLSISFKTNLDTNIIFKNGISGTPRLVRDGKSVSEAQSEGNSGRRFIHSQLPRTILGYNKDKTKFYLLTIAGTNSAKRQYGASLKDLSNIALNLNLYDAMNLDGGGSSAFLLYGKNLLRDYSPFSSRKLSVIIGVKK
ncbi:MAG: hypothetical protein A2X64_06685 [Ignavibacteria bacterium GWF2_33_9]|nr:MAG: hypothetical protein A2X64_06685 [Ignavibacteria bacterium GWF2_33_9]